MTDDSVWSAYDDEQDYEAGTLCLTMDPLDAPEERYVALGATLDDALEAASELCEDARARGYVWRWDDETNSTRLATIDRDGAWRMVGA